MERLLPRGRTSGGPRVAVVRAFNLVGPGQPPFNAASALARQIARPSATASRRSSWLSATPPQPAT